MYIHVTCYNLSCAKLCCINTCSSIEKHISSWSATPPHSKCRAWISSFIENTHTMKSAVTCYCTRLITKFTTIIVNMSCLGGQVSALLGQTLLYLQSGCPNFQQLFTLLHAQNRSALQITFMSHYSFKSSNLIGLPVFRTCWSAQPRNSTLPDFLSRGSTWGSGHKTRSDSAPCCWCYYRQIT